MANAHQENKQQIHQENKQQIHRIEDEVRKSAERASEEAKRIGETTVKAGEKMARAGTDLLQQNMEMFQKSWSFGAEMAAGMFNRSNEYLGRSLGVSGEGAQQATERSTCNAESILYSATTAAKGMNNVSQEYFDFVKQQFQKSMDRMNDVWSCRSPQDFAAVQTDLMRDAFSDLFERNRRIADTSIRLAEDAGKHVNKNMAAG